MPTVEAVYLSGISMMLEDCETVGDVMAKIAISHVRLATYIVVVDPVSGRQMISDEDMQIPKVEFVILNETANMDIESCKLNLRLHAGQNDHATCSNLLDALRILDPDYIVMNPGGVLSDALLSKKSKWGVVARTLLQLGISGNAALLGVVEAGRADIVQFLVSDAMNTELGWAPDLIAALLKACETNHTQVVKVLLDAEADANSYAEDDDTALNIASHWGHADIARILLDAGADVNRKGLRGFTALIMASYWGHAEIVRILLDAEADVNSKRCGQTALIEASIGGHAAIVRILLDAGLDGREEAVRLLLEAGANGWLRKTSRKLM